MLADRMESADYLSTVIPYCWTYLHKRALLSAAVVQKGVVERETGCYAGVDAEVCLCRSTAE